MMNKINGVLRIHFKDITMWLFLPLAIFLGNVVISSTFNIFRDEIKMKNSIAMIYVFMFVMGVIIIGRTFYFAIGLSVRRRDYMLGTMMTVGIVTTILSVFFALISVIETYFSFDLGIMLNLSPSLNNMNFFGKFYINFSIFIHLFFLGMLINCLIRQFGKNLIWIVGLLILGFANLDPLENLAIAFVKILWELPPLALFSWSLPVSVLYACFSYMILRRLPA